MGNTPQPVLSVITLGVADLRASARFYEALGFVRKVKATGDEVAFFDAGAVVLALYPWDKLADDAQLPAEPLPTAFRGSTLAWNCASRQDVDGALAHAGSVGGRVLKRAETTGWGGYSGYFADPDGHPWEVVYAPMFPMAPNGRLMLPD
jgi:predicted lactoylglutathione lyase